MNKPLQLAVYNEVSKYPVEEKVKQFYGCIIYKYVEAISRQNTSVNNSISQLVSSYAGNVINQVEALKGKYVSYNLMLQETERIGKNNFYEYIDEDVQKIYTLYLDKTLLDFFSIKYFRQSMYKITNLTHKEYQKLQKIHKDLMVPICLYYMEYYGIPDSAMEIYSVKQTADDVIGNEIVFSIQSIAPSRVVADIKTGKLLLDFNNYNVEVYGNYVRISI